MGGAWTNSSTGPPTHAMTMQSASRPGSRCDSDRPSRFTTTNVFASRNTTSATRAERDGRQADEHQPRQIELDGQPVQREQAQQQEVQRVAELPRFLR